MKISKLNRITISFKKYPWKESGLSLKYLPRVFSKLEKIILVFLSCILILAVFFLLYNNWLKSTKIIPAYGGQFSEGILGESSDMQKNLIRLTNAGLTKYDSEKNIVGDIAERWEIKDNGKVYEFHLRESFSSEDLASQIVNGNLWTNIEISTPEPQILTFTFKQPFSPFLYTTTEPIFEYGPYRLIKEEKNQLELQAREDYYNGKPYISKVILKLYSDEPALLKAARQGEIQGLVSDGQCLSLKGYEQVTTALPRDLILFFNLNNSELKKIEVRKALRENSSLGRELSFRLVTTDNSQNIQLAKDIAEKWAKNGITIDLQIKDNVTLKKEIIPKRDYDLLLYGLDYGEDPDPYPFWHSSQISQDGKNLSSFKNTKADKLLEQARLEFDIKKRNEMYAQFQEILNSEIPMLVVEHESYCYEVSNKVQGLTGVVGTNESDRFIDIAKWFLETKREKK